MQASIRLDHIRHNVDVLGSQSQPARLMAVLKADAYGHGLPTVASTLANAGVSAFAVARVHEAVALRNAGLRGLILVLAPPTVDELPLFVRHALHASVTSPQVAELLINASLSAPLPIHLKVDTGMHRLGVDATQAASWWTRLHNAPSVRPDGVYTHLATANTPDHPLNETQLQRFQQVLKALSPSPHTVHVANTDALVNLQETLPKNTQYVRCGLGLYGLTSTPSSPSISPVQDALRPALALSARVLHVHTVPQGETVSYGAQWTASRDTCIATIGIGYGDGYPRAATGKAEVRVHGTRRPLVGTVCMDLCMVDLGAPTSPLAQRTNPGDHVVIFDEQGPTLHEVAAWSGTIPYEICCQLAPRVPRTYLDRDTVCTGPHGTI